MMRRREFIVGLGSAVAWPVVAQAQGPVTPVIGWLHPEQPEAMRDVFLPAFREGLAKTGFVEGRNVAIEYRWGEGHPERMPVFAEELVRQQVAVIVVPGNVLASLAAKAATPSIPVIFMIGADPVEVGLVASFSRPGGNLTGVAGLSSAVSSKRLEMLHEMVPAATSVAMFVNPANAYYAQLDARDVPAAARTLGLRLLILSAGTESDLSEAFGTIAVQQVGAVLIGSDSFFWTVRDQIISLAARYAIPIMFLESKAVSSGGLSSYGPDLAGEYFQIGVYTGRVLKGEKPAELPVIQPTKFELTINLQTAKSLGLKIPPTVLAIADRVIE